MTRRVLIWTVVLGAVVIAAAVGLVQVLFGLMGDDRISRWQLSLIAVATAGVLSPIFHGPLIWLVLTHRILARQLRAAALTDCLTGLPNRRAFFEHASRLLRAPVPPHRTFAVLMIDVDRFKDLNDRLGHEAGDAALVRVAQGIGGALAGVEEAMLARIGGEEFAVLLDGAGPERAAQVAETLCASVRDIVLERRGRRVPLTISIGVWSGRAAEIDGPLAQADAAAYAAKARGRDRWIMASARPMAYGSLSRSA